MAINRKVCAVCLEKHIKKHGKPDWIDHAVVALFFNTVDDAVVCWREQERKTAISLIVEPPKDCPYILEHTVSEGVDG